LTAALAVAACPALAADDSLAALSESIGETVPCPQQASSAWAEFDLVCVRPEAQDYVERWDTRTRDGQLSLVRKDSVRDATGETEFSLYGKLPEIERRYYARPARGGGAVVLFAGPDLAILATSARDIPLDALQQGAPLVSLHPLAGRSLFVPPFAEHKPEPEYPKKARKRNVQGNVILQFRMGADGVPREIEVLRCTAPGLGFEESAIETVGRWRYRPGLVDGEPVSFWFTVFVSFKLN